MFAGTDGVEHVFVAAEARVLFQARLLTERLQVAGYDAQYVHALYHLTDGIPYAHRLRERVGPRRMCTETRRTGPWRPLYLARWVLFGWVGYLFALGTIFLVSVRSRDRIVVFDRYYHQFLYDVYGPASLLLSRSLPQPWRTVHLDAELDTLGGALAALLAVDFRQAHDATHA